MTNELRQQIIDTLTVYLNRAPTENEIQNAVTDTITMGKIREKELVEIKKKTDKLN